ncbi:hypothetical protein BGX27_011438 [Mortierella sp. AM989]|nr:hypothetical protein BGX27_011438 [Mortierella sp. AM989]
MKPIQQVALFSFSLFAVLNFISPSPTTHALPSYLASRSSKSSSLSLPLTPSPTKQHLSKPTPSPFSKSLTKSKEKTRVPEPQKPSRQLDDPKPLLSSTEQLLTPRSRSDPPLLLLPSSNSVWHAGSAQTVKWSKKYTKRLPKDTTIDIILVDSKTNKKILSLKRFIPIRKGTAQVWVPSRLPEDASYMLVLELYHGRSQKTATVTATLPNTPASTTTSSSPATKTPAATDNKIGKAIPSILRRSDINIAHRARKVTREEAITSSITPAAHDMYDDDYYKGHKETQPLEFAPDEFRQEYPNVVQPIELEHTFGLHRKVYTMAPYTLGWNVPSRVTELLEYTRTRLNLIVDKTIDLEMHHSLHDNNQIFMAKVQVELIQDQSLEPVSVLARNVPAETKFQYLQIHKRVPPAFYRLKVQMVVVAVESSAEPDSPLNYSDASESRVRLAHGDYMEGWDFPSGGRVIDRYESITRRFWVSEGAL